VSETFASNGNVTAAFASTSYCGYRHERFDLHVVRRLQRPIQENDGNIHCPQRRPLTFRQQSTGRATRDRRCPHRRQRRVLPEPSDLSSSITTPTGQRSKRLLSRARQSKSTANGALPPSARNAPAWPRATQLCAHRFPVRSPTQRRHVGIPGFWSAPMLRPDMEPSTTTCLAGGLP